MAIVRTYIVETLKDNFYFCPNCHTRVDLPFKGDVNIKGNLNVLCGRCNKGKVKIVKKDDNGQ